MARRFVVLVLTWLGLALFALPHACRHAGGGEATVKEQVTDDERPPNFIGCRPSSGECVNSCPQRNGVAELDARLCQRESIEPWACYCGRPPQTERPAEPTEDTHLFVGCRRSTGECFNSCATRRGVALENPARCPEGRLEGPYACFCDR